MTMNHEFIVGKTRCRALDEQIIMKPGANMAKPLIEWLTDGEPAAVVVEVVKPVQLPTKITNQTYQPVTSPEGEPGDDEAAEREAIQEEAAPTTERQHSSPVATLAAKIEACATLGDLASVKNEIKTALADKLITMDEYTGVLSPVFAGKNKALKAQAAA